MREFLQLNLTHVHEFEFNPTHTANAEYIIHPRSQQIGNIIDYEIDIIRQSNGSRKRLTGLVFDDELLSGGNQLLQSIKTTIRGAYE